MIERNITLPEMILWTGTRVRTWRGHRHVDLKTP
jgi:hypothetical protein